MAERTPATPIPDSKRRARIGNHGLRCLSMLGIYCERHRQHGENDMGRLDGKIAVITGATSGIGLWTAEIFVAEGAKIVIAGRRALEGEALAKKLGAACVFLKTDVTREDQMQVLIGTAIDRFGRVD